MSPTSLILNRNNAEFVERQVRHSSVTKTEVINQALDLYRKYLLRKELREGFSSQTDEDAREAMSDITDYISIIERE
jgi:hypothetical protein